MKWFKSKNSKNDREENWAGKGRLAEMIQAAREADSDARLSGAARGRILDAAFRTDVGEEPLPSMFMPTRRLVVAGALPVLLAAVLLVSLDRGVRTPPPPADAGPLVAVSKHGDKVLFDLGNGGRQHVVYRSTQPNRFEPSTGVAVTDGAYADHLSDQADLVFYRID